MAVESTLGVLLDRLVLAVQSLSVFLFIVAAVYLPGRFLVVPALERAADAASLDQTLRLPLLKVTGASFFVLGLYLAVPLSGLATTPTTIAAMSAGVTIAIGFASRDVLANLVSGAFLVVDPEFHIGDWIQWNGREGVIEDIGFRVTRVHTFDNELVTVPNSMLTANVVTNPATKDRRRVSFDFGIGYDDDVAEARRILVETARRHEEILDRPATRVVLTDLGESAVGLRAMFWVGDPARAELLRIESEYVEAVKARFEAAGIEMPYPYRQLTGEVGTWDATDRAGE